jgi:class 3 adenylate cyclase
MPSDDAPAIAQCLRSLATGIAIADGASWSILFENARFDQWFPSDGAAEETLADRLAGLDRDRARERLAQGRPFAYETEVRAGARTVALAVELRRETIGARDYVVAECRNVSKQKEVEYMLDSYSKLAEKNARELQKEKERVEKLLLNLMPRSVYEEMKEFGTATPQRFDSASVLMLDFVGFTDMAISQDPSAVVAELNDIFSSFDRIVELFGCERIKTIGDAYMAVAGLPEPNPDQASSIAKVALRLRRYLGRRNASHSTQWKCRIGVATGPLIGSLVGVQKYVYDVFGPAVNLAARLESLSDPLQITVCEATYERIREDFIVTERGAMEVKGFGPINLFSLEDEVRGRH